MPVSFQGPVMSDAYLRNYMGAVMAIDQQLAEQKAQAIRWQGARDYDTLVQSGIDPRDALRRTAPKMFFNDPRALAASIPSMLSSPGQLWTDPDTGRQYTIDRFGNYKAVPQEQRGWTTVYGDYGQRFTIPLQPGQAPSMTQGPPLMPPVVTGPNNQQFMLYPNRAQPLRQDPTQIVTYKDPTTGADVTITRGEYELGKRRAEAADVMKDYNKAAAAAAGGDWKPFFDWSLNPSMPWTNRMSRAEEQLRQMQLTPSGEPLPGSPLEMQVYGAGMPQADYQMMGPPAPPVSAAPTAVQQPSYQLGPDEVLMKERATGRDVIWNRRTQTAREAR